MLAKSVHTLSGRLIVHKSVWLLWEQKYFMYVLFTLGLGWRNHGGRKSHVHFGVSIDTKSKGGVGIRLVADWIFGFHCTRSLIVSYSSNALGFSIKGRAHSIGLIWK